MLKITHLRGKRAPGADHFGGSVVRIGAAPGSDLGLAGDPAVLPQHAEIRNENGVWSLVDLGSASGTLVNHVRVARQPLKLGDVITIGSTEFRVDLLPGAAAPPPQARPAPAHPQPAPAQAAYAPPPRHAHAQQPAQAQPNDGTVDLETARRMVQAAVDQAAAGDDKSAHIIAKKVDDARRRVARHNTLLTVGVSSALLAVLATGFFVWRSHVQASVLASEAGLNSTASKPKGEIPTKVYTGREIYEANKGAMYVIGYLLGDKVGACCTAFAIAPTTLATNAHCVLALKEKGGTPVVTLNDSGGKTRFRILGMQQHPGYKANGEGIDSPDVGLLRVDTKMPSTVTLANDAELRSIGPGDDVFVLGFPGRVMDPISPSVTFLSGHVGRIMGFAEEATTPDKSVIVQHDAVTRGGNSGSPIFNQYGHVIAVHAAHIDEETDEAHDGQKKTVVDASPFRIGMRIDLIKGVPQP